MRTLQPTPTRTNTTTPSYIPKDLHHSTHVLVRRDAVKPSLTPPYDGPFKVIKRLKKSYILNLNGREDTVSIDRLKLAILDQPSDPKQEVTKTLNPKQVIPKTLKTKNVNSKQVIPIPKTKKVTPRTVVPQKMVTNKTISPPPGQKKAKLTVHFRSP
jgi:hypothetical protein